MDDREEEDNYIEKNPFNNDNNNIDDIDNNKKGNNNLGNEFIDFSQFPKAIKNILQDLDENYNDIETKINNQKEKYEKIKNFFNNINLSEKMNEIDNIIIDIGKIRNKLNEIKEKTINLK